MKHLNFEVVYCGHLSRDIFEGILSVLQQEPTK